jgi:hypothetical protein
VVPGAGAGIVGGRTSITGALAGGAVIVGAGLAIVLPCGGSDVVFFGAGAGAGAGDGAGIFFGGVWMVSPDGTGAGEPTTVPAEQPLPHEVQVSQQESWRWKRAKKLCRWPPRQVSHVLHVLQVLHEVVQLLVQLGV